MIKIKRNVNLIKIFVHNINIFFKFNILIIIWRSFCELYIMTSFNLPENLILTGNLWRNWKIFEQNLTLYLIASGLEKESDKRKIAILLNIIGKEGVQIYNSFPDSEESTYDDVLRHFREYCEPKKNILQSRFIFYQRKQNIGERFDHFLTDVKKIAKDCRFVCEEEVIRDKLVFGTSDKNSQRKFITEGDPNLEDVINKLRLAEIENIHAADQQDISKKIEGTVPKSNGK